MTPALVVLLGALVLLWLTWKYSDQQDQRRAQHTIDRLMSPRAQALFDEITMIVSEDQYVVGRWHERALEQRRAGDLDAARRILAEGCTQIEDLAPDFLSALHELRRLARTVAVMVALPPVRPMRFRSTRLRGLAAVGTAVHHTLATGRQQTLLRLAVVRAAFRMALRFLRRAVGQGPRRDDDWTQVGSLVADLHTSGDEALATARRVLTALDDDRRVRMRSDDDKPTDPTDAT